MTQPSINTRIATEADDEAILAVEAVSWDSSSGFPSMREPKESAFNERTTPANYVLAEVDGKVVGYSRLMPKTPVAENSHVKGIYGLAVVPEARGLGVASKLLEASADEARRQGARKISLGVFSTNEPARRLYAKHGYFEEGRSKDEFLVDGAYVDNIMLAKVL
ncbi:GNAT family N-acetyltransferase [Phytomonospora endophytica]|uniref:Ribosomal protein S18 acetylase RimI-like enzyme n=1 Tax=Phytomonospora endophytica TaxID=714109 RepID=A0A841FSD6_9ACTN|nr:GNAT family N-acetyltransferase [Phytomonospora endophytica]MBB6038956.1 ribosomal protein S18 acetylase RimI-like enzyme [Phytomonospora endophytica]GIG67940.1 N-acetyltransferase [Phytomonospora endophytica]